MTRDVKPRQTSSSMEEVAAKRPEEVRPPAVTKKPREARGAKAWLRARAKVMRKEMTPAERAVWRILHEGELVALNWRKQAPFGDFILDFVSHPARLVVEVDGAQHGESDHAAADAARTAWLKSEGYEVVRVWNQETRMLADGVWHLVHHAASRSPAARRMDRWRVGNLANIHTANERALRGSSVDTEGAPPQSALRADSSSIEEERGAFPDKDVQR